MILKTGRWLILAFLGMGWTDDAHAQVAGPPVAKYRVSLRYYIPSPRDEHVVQYDALIEHLKRLAFEFDPPLAKHPDTDREDRTKNYLEGAIDSNKVPALLEQPVVQTILLIPLAPEEFKLPENPEDPVMVRLELGGNLPRDRQRELANQTRVLLRELGFKEPAGYDQRSRNGRPYTRIVGTIPRGKLDLLQRDLRSHPAGWIGPVIPREELPTPLRFVNPVQIIEVLPDTEAIKDLVDPEPRQPEFLEKISPDLWDLVKGKEPEPLRIRVQIGFVGPLTPNDEAWKLTLSETVPGIFVESQLGAFVTGTLRLDQVKALAAAPLVSFIRLPRAPQVNVSPELAIKGDNQKALELTGLKELHGRGYRGKGVRVAIIDRDFRGWEDLVKRKLLPVKTRLVDLTTELNPEIYPAPGEGGAGAGHGTQCAQAVALAAPQAELILIRTPLDDPHHLHDVARYIEGGAHSNLIERRHGELVARAAALTARREELLRERRIILEDFTDETDLRESLSFLGPVFAWLYSDREWHRQRMDYHEKLEEEQRRREQRFRDFLTEIARLKGIPIVVNTMAWQAGYPLGGAGPLAKTLGQSRDGPLWFQGVGNTRGQSWLAPYRHFPGDPAMQFADPEAPLPGGRWSSEVNFLAWQPYQGERKPDLPEGARLRFTMQWREPHDPDYFLRPREEDPYRRPLAQLRLQFLRQRDPETVKLPADAFTLVARTSGWPERLDHMPAGSVYEQVLEVPLEKGGRYALRVERQMETQWVLAPHPLHKTPVFQLQQGLAPSGIRPLGMPTLPALEKRWELRPRIFVEVIDAARLQGRAVFADFPTEAGAIGLPADAHNVISVGAANFAKKPQPYSAFGSPAQAELAIRPWLYAYDELELAGGGAFGTSIASAFAAGTSAAYLSTGVPREQVLAWLRSRKGQVLRVAE
jgi:hypothetical protein